MSENLKVIYNNFVTSSNVTASSSAGGTTPASNLAAYPKGLVWRSGATTTAILLVNLGSSVLVDGVILPFTNLTSAATIQVIGYSTAPTLGGTVAVPTISGGTVEFDTTAIDACPWERVVPWGTGSIPAGANTYAYGGGQCARCWIPVGMQEAVTHLTIQITDASLSYIEASHLVVGKSWSPKYNTSYGLSLTPTDTSTSQRAVSGDLYTNRGTLSNILKMDLKYMDSTDKLNFLNICRTNGLSKPLFVSLFPEDEDPAKERDFQIYGKMSSLDSIVHSTYTIYSTQVSIEEL